MNQFEGMSDDEIAEAVVARLRNDFLASANLRITVIEEALKVGRLSGGVSQETMTEIGRAVHNLKGMGTTFGYPLVTQVAERFEAALKQCLDLGPKEIERAQAYLDTLIRVLAKEKAPSIAEASQILAALPSSIGT